MSDNEINFEDLAAACAAGPRGGTAHGRQRSTC